MDVIEHKDADSEFLFCNDWLQLTGQVCPTADSVIIYWLNHGGLYRQAG